VHSVDELFEQVCYINLFHYSEQVYYRAPKTGDVKVIGATKTGYHTKWCKIGHGCRTTTSTIVYIYETQYETWSQINIYK
jgi:hypothetical protein